jgi:hypothetical protein
MAATESKPNEHRDATWRCPLCGCAEFHVREYALRTTENEFFHLTWTADPLKAYICGKCGNVQWFA